MNTKEIIQLLRRQRFSMTNEKFTQTEIAKCLTANEVEFSRELRLDVHNIIDFAINGIGIEVKIKGRKREIYNQLVRYAAFDQITELILLTTLSLNLPETISNKPVTIINLLRAWL